jgi:mannosyltransferase
MFATGKEAAPAGHGVGRRPGTGALVALGIVAAGVAVAARLPFCGESLWVDELHSAWTVWDSIGEVAPRAALGNQTPLYYWGLWFWRQIVGDSEVGLRLSGVVLSSVACGVVAAGVAHQTRRLLGGALAGFLLATDPTAVFFGTELRVFPAVLLLSAVACWAWMQDRQSGSVRSLGLLACSVALAGAIQPTSVGVLGWTIVDSVARRFDWRFLGVRGDGDEPPAGGVWSRWAGRMAVVAFTILAAMLFWRLAGSVLVAAWRHRDQWAAMGSIRSPWQLWTLWRWNALLVVPAGLAAVALLWDRVWRRVWVRTPPAEVAKDLPPGPPVYVWWLPPALLAVLATVSFAAVSAFDVAAVFHRRYLIAALPPLAWAGGAVLAAGIVALERGRVAKSPSPPNAADFACIGASSARIRTLAAGILLFVPATAFNIIGIMRAPRVAVQRGEDWRGAVAWVNQAARSGSGQTIWVSPGLIETERFLASGDPAKIDYLTFPLHGPYRIDHPVVAFDIAADPAVQAGRLAEGQSLIAVIRGSERLANVWANQILASLPGGIDGADPRTFRVHRFGRVQVVEFESSPLVSLRK